MVVKGGGCVGSGGEGVVLLLLFHLNITQQKTMEKKNANNVWTRGLCSPLPRLRRRF